jgi:hypothetical protein
MFAKSLKRVVLAVALCSLALAGLGCPALYIFLPTDEVTIVVKDKSTGSPIKDAQVSFNIDGDELFDDVTDDNGVLKVTLVRGVEYKITASKTGFIMGSKDFVVTRPKKNTDFNTVIFELIPSGGVSSSASGGKKRIP